MSDETKPTTDQELEASFNDDELQDIMNEIESLEQEFGGEEEAVEEAPAAEMVDDAQQIDDELKAMEDEIESMEEDAPEPLVTAEEVAESEEAAPLVHQIHSAAKKPSHAPCAHFEAQGQMEMKLSVPMGEHTAELSWGPDGLSVCVQGVQILVGEEGCTLELPGGAKFVLPVESKTDRKAA